jgi:hypothetical protein
MKEIIIKADEFTHDSNLIPLVRWLFPECQIHLVPSENTATHRQEDYSSMLLRR